MPSDAVLPSKSFLIKICKTELNVDYKKLNLNKMPSLKDRIIFAIYMHHVLSSSIHLGQQIRSTQELEE
jgi:hypothetical protein